MTKPKITPDTITHIARLAELNLSHKEETGFADQLAGVINYFEKLSSVNTENIEPLFVPGQESNVLRDDKVDATETLSQEKALTNAKKVKNGNFVVPAVINNEL